MSAVDLDTRGRESESFEEHEARETAEKSAPAPVEPVPAADAAVAEETPAVAEESKPERGRRSRQQDASPADVPRIRQLTAQKHEERQLREAAEARISALEAQLAEMKAGQAKPAPQTPTGFTLEKPDLTKFVGEGKSYEDWVEALADWKVEKRLFDQSEAQAKEKAASAEQRQIDKVRDGYKERATAFAKDHPDFADVIKEHTNVNVPALLNTVFLTDDNGPAFVYHLAQHPDQLSEMILITEDRPVNENSVATVRRLLTARLAAAPTGSAAQAPFRRIASPPNPVRTGMQTPAASEADDSESYEAFEARENARDRERRRRR